MMDFNHSNKFHDRLNKLVDDALLEERKKQVPRDYLGASRLGVECSRALQYEYWNTPKDEGKDFDGQLLRIFDTGHLFEDLSIKWLTLAGLEIYTRKNDGQQFGFSVAGGRIQGHVDGIINNAPIAFNFMFPMLWEHKSMNDKNWKETVKKGVTLAKPVYAAQVALYQAYMEPQIPGISGNPALFTAVNKDTEELYHELMPFDSALAQTMSDKGVNILHACDAGELLPRIANSSTFHICKMCSWAERCWRQPA